MKFINKTLNQVAANLLVNTFLNNRWDAVNNRYTLIGYKQSQFKLNLRPALKQQLLTDQKYLCCYCMRSLVNDETTTLEHIVPKSTNTAAGLNLYSHYPIIRNNVCLQSVFSNATAQVNTPPFPLEIAYENLAASCKGDFPGGVTYHICNHKRESNFIEPLFYIASIETDITYRKGGLIISLNPTWDASIITLNLNYDSLERIRQVWYHLSIETMADILNATTEADRSTILTVNLISLSATRRTQLVNDFKTDTFWNMLLQYKFFHNYYLTTYPIATR